MTRVVPGPGPSSNPRAADLEAARTIRKKTGLDFADGVLLCKFWQARHYLVQEVSVRALGTQPDGARRKKIDSARKALERYVKLSSELREENLHPPIPPRGYLESAERWFHDHLEHANNLEKSKSRTGDERRLYVHAAGLFHAAFDKEPTAWADEGARPGETRCSDLVTFVKLIMDLAPRHIDETSLGVKGDTGRRKLQRLWQPRNEQAISQGLKPALKQSHTLYNNKQKHGAWKMPPVKVADEPVVGQEEEWKVWACFYRSLLGRKKREPQTSQGKPRDENDSRSS